jgi:undecaprenyl-diphosphatase
MAPWLTKRSGVRIAFAAAVLAPWPAAAAAAPPTDPGQLAVDPVSDGIMTATGIGLSTLLGAILATGEIKPTAPTAGPSVLLAFDRAVATQSPDPNASTYSNAALWVAEGFAALDPVLSGIRYGWDALLVDAVIYAESTALTSALTDMVKIAVRRPRPFDYTHPSTTSTDAELSFPSGHASGVASVAATASYLAFVRSPRSPRAWITLTAGVLLTAFVSYERVRAGAHFPTDVVAGSLLGASVGVLVPHLHRRERPPVWIGAAPLPEGRGATLTLRATF